jgi:MoaA/NifB/PqqE/SkfB family radical SAM enzyme
MPKTGSAGSTDRIARVWRGRGHYGRRFLEELRDGVRLADLLRTQVPYLLPDARHPPAVALEFTNRCNLSCPYCTSPLNLRPRGLMSRTTFDLLISQIRSAGIPRVLVVGNGEPTLHPHFPEYIRELTQATRSVELTSNWQRITEPIARSVVEAGLSRLHISVHGATREAFETGRASGLWEDLHENLRLLQRVRHDHPRRSPLVNIRVMIRPSDQAIEKSMRAYWAPFGDEVTATHLVDYSGTDHDVFGLKCEVGVYPRCAWPFKIIGVNWDGNVPLCSHSWVQSGRPEGLVLGNIHDHSLADIWNGETLRSYRAGHRSGDSRRMPICEGCCGS